MRQEIITRIAILMTKKFSGPIAHLRHLKEYKDICPGSADRIIKMAEARTDHINDIERQSLVADIADQKRGMNYGAGLFILLIAAAFGSACLKLGPVIVGLFWGTASIGGVGMIIKGRNGE